MDSISVGIRPLTSSATKAKTTAPKTLRSATAFDRVAELWPRLFFLEEQYPAGDAGMGKFSDLTREAHFEQASAEVKSEVLGGFDVEIGEVTADLKERPRLEPAVQFLETEAYGCALVDGFAATFVFVSVPTLQ